MLGIPSTEPEVGKYAALIGKCLALSVGVVADELHEHFDMVCLSITVLKQVLNPGGFNIGMNIGGVAGAGIEDHIHTHVVPRWQGDTNYMPIISDTRVVPEAITETYQRLVGKF